MPQREAKFEVNAAPQEVWRFIRDFESLCACIPGVEKVRRVDDRTAELTVREKVGIVPLTSPHEPAFLRGPDGRPAGSGARRPQSLHRP